MTVFENNNVSQTNIDADKVVGRDDHSVNFNLTLNAPTVYNEDTVLKDLLKEHEAEKLINSDYRDFSAELNKFFSKVMTGKLRDLEEKLSDGGRESLIDIALESKEKVAKKILRHSHYKSAQEIYTYLLTNIRSAFLHEVQSKIRSGSFEQYQIDEIVCSKIIEPLLHNLQGSSLHIDKHELYGVLYFLTGNCYIAWD